MCAAGCARPEIGVPNAVALAAEAEQVFAGPTAAIVEPVVHACVEEMRSAGRADALAAALQFRAVPHALAFAAPLPAGLAGGGGSVSGDIVRLSATRVPAWLGRTDTQGEVVAVPQPATAGAAR